MASFYASYPFEGASGAGSGTVTSVGLIDGSGIPIYSISGSPVTTAGNLTFSLNNESANTVFAGPSSGSAAQPTFRALVMADLPSQTQDAITALTGDGTATGPGSVALTLATVNSNIGSFGSSTSIPSFTVNGKGLITAAAGNVVIAPAGTLSGTTLNSTIVSSSLTSVGTITSGVWNGTVTAGQSVLTSGTTYTTPSGITTATRFKFFLVGGGAGGAYGSTASENNAGGGGGACVIIYAVGLSPSTGYTMTIGSAGVGGTESSSTPPTAGGNTTLTLDSITYTSGGGSIPSSEIDTGLGGAGGTATNTFGTGFSVSGLNIPGSAGGNASTSITNGGAGGNSGNLFGSGGQPVHTTATNGNAATGYGGGGGGASGATGNGGAGTQGCIIVEWNN